MNLRKKTYLTPQTNIFMFDSNIIETSGTTPDYEGPVLPDEIIYTDSDITNQP